MRDLSWLEDSLAAIDRVYFSDELAHRGVCIKWMRWRRTKRWLRVGAWDSSRNTIEIHKTMALPAVPDYVVLWAVYHEACHTILGDAHDTAFLLAEARFVHYAEVQKWFAEGAWEELLHADKPF